VVMLLVVACAPPEAEKPPPTVTGPAGADAVSYSLSVLIVHPSDDSFLEPYQHFSQALHVGVRVDHRPAQDLSPEDLEGIDLLYVTGGTLGEELLSAYLEAGGTVFLEQDAAYLFSTDVQPEGDTFTDITFPPLAGPESVLQDPYRRFVRAAKRYGVFEEGERAAPLLSVGIKGIVPLATRDGRAFLALRRQGPGTVIWGADILFGGPSHHGRLDLGGPGYFNWTRATAARMFRESLLTYVAWGKYGVALRKVLGPYGRPTVSWQNHYEEARSFGANSMIRFTELLREHRQVPSYTLIRIPYIWGRWQGSLRLHRNIGTEGQPLFRGMGENSAFASGTPFRYDLDLGRQPGYLSFLADFTSPIRPVPRAVDLDSDGVEDLLVGTADGRVLLLPGPSFGGESYLTVGGSPLRAGEHAAPEALDIDLDGRLDLVVGTADGSLHLFLGTARIGSFTYAGPLAAKEGPVKVGGMAVPAVADLDGDGVEDLAVGTRQGNLLLLKGAVGPDGLSFSRWKVVAVEGASHVAPTFVDFNSDGRTDLIYGDASGRVYLVSDVGGHLRGDGPLRGRAIEGDNRNFFGDMALDVGRNAAPAVLDDDGDELLDLLVGGLEYGAGFPLNSRASPYLEQVRRNIRHVLENHLEIGPHVYVHSYKTEAEERHELELHRRAFELLGLPWEGTGANQHTWYVNREDPLQSFKLQMESGLVFNFGWRAPGAPRAPRTGKNYLWSFPFLMMEGEALHEFLLWNPAPHHETYRKAYEDLLHWDLPITYFEHVEWSLTPGTEAFANLMETVAFLGSLRDRYDYNFTTESQAARSFFTALLSRVEARVTTRGGVTAISLDPDPSAVPAWVGEYARTLGVAVVLPPGDQRHLSTTSFFQYTGDGTLYVGVPGPTTVLVGGADEGPLWHIIRANVPVEVRATDRGTWMLEIGGRGMQEVKLAAPAGTELYVLDGDRQVPASSPGTGLWVRREGDYITVTHFGQEFSLELRLPGQWVDSPPPDNI